VSGLLHQKFIIGCLGTWGVKACHKEVKAFPPRRGCIKCLLYIGFDIHSHGSVSADGN